MTDDDTAALLHNVKSTGGSPKMTLPEAMKQGCVFIQILGSNVQVGYAFVRAADWNCETRSNAFAVM
jgi:hypothetical protein